MARGFTEVGVFAVKEMPQVAICLLAKPAEAVCAAVYEHPKVGTWVELFSRYQDGTGITYSTMPDRGLEPRPGHPAIHAPGTSAEALYDRIMRERPQQPLAVITPEKLPHYFELAYAEGMAWRKNKGLTAEEVIRVAKTRKPDADE